MADYVPVIRALTLFLNNALPQSPQDVSKTQKAINYIKHFGWIGRFNAGILENGNHHITVVLTNNNLGEAAQWKIRLKKKLKQLNSTILSSKKDSDMKNLDTFKSKLLDLEKADNLPDLLVMCTNEKRTADLIDFIKTLKRGRLDLKNIGIHHITLSIMFDEADKNIKLIVECLKEIWPLLSLEDEKKDDIIRDIHFITATPLDEFWKQLNKCGIQKLKNINKAIKDMDKDNVLNKKTYKELMDQYRWLNDHTIDTSISDMTENPIEYAQLHLRKWGRHSSETSKIVFAPADVYVETHNQMRGLFISYGYWVYINNGQLKGFTNPHGKFQSDDDFRKEHSVDGEPYEVFQKWRQLHPNDSLAITGWLTIIRGITFNTTGFNFTNMILSSAHMKNLADLLQVAGRGNGDIQFVNKFTFHCPEIVWNTISERITLMKELHESDPDEFKEHDFRPKTKKEVLAVAMTVPHVIKITQEEYSLSIQKKGREYDSLRLIEIIGHYNVSLANELKTMKKKQITHPEKEKSIKKHITDFLKASEENRKYTIDIQKEEIESKQNLYQIFIDKTPGDYKFIVSIFNGSLLELDD
jgi:hypothetical protein